ncbi:hypothetical protein KUCAC02_015094 [Chaenocephalus aceratus]|uniref:Uncharacterized protein n=1 Tax=Chaenocephalus aceratus TaxID=36190 RepID=A0ACB9XWF4_CHAAC|nr:hypothetical protein KUCAC02_015094 [Chaenocephalus aceratus]
MLTQRCFRCVTAVRNTLVTRGCSTVQGDVRVRFAPSPTGFLHLGGLRTALYNYIFAKKYGGSFVLRLEDTDQSRLVPGAAESIEDMLEWAGVPPDESPRRGGRWLSETRPAQQRGFKGADRHPGMITGAVTSGPSQVQEKLDQGAPHVIRFRLEEGVEPFQDLICGRVINEVAQVEGDPVVMKSRRFSHLSPGYIVDDHYMMISHVLRGSEWLISTSKQPPHPPTFGHLPLLLNKNGSKLSKRQGDISSKASRGDGVLPEALLDITPAAARGFNTIGVGRRIDELIAEFNPSKITTHSALLDLEKLPEFNRIHLQHRIEDEEQCATLITGLQAQIQQVCGEEMQEEVLQEGYIRRVLLLRKGHISSLKELVGPAYSYLWVRPSVSSQQVAAITAEAQHIAALVLKLIAERGEELTVDRLSKDLKTLVKQTKGIKYGEVMKLLRLALSGLQQGPSVAEMMVCLGPEEISHRFQKLLQFPETN